MVSLKTKTERKTEQRNTRKTWWHIHVKRKMQKAKRGQTSTARDINRKRQEG